MTNENKKITAVRISDLPQIDDPTGFWIPGSKVNEKGALVSGRYSLDQLLEYARSLQLERRLSFSLIRNTVSIFIGEPTTLKFVKGVNISNLKLTVQQLTVNANGNEILTPIENEITVPLREAINVEIPTDALITFSITRHTIDAESHLFIFAAIKNLKI